MQKVFFKPSKFTTKGQTFDTDSGMGGTFAVKFVKKAGDKYHFTRVKTPGWPKANYVFTEDQLTSEIFLVIPDKFERVLFSTEKQQEYNTMLADEHIDRVE